MQKKDEPLADLAGAILDGTAVHWPAVESTTDEPTKAVIRQLRVVAEIAEIYRREPAIPIAEGASDGVPAQPPELLEQWGHFKILEFVGSGSFGEVYRAWNTRLDREVALKLLHPSRTGQDSLGSSVIQEGRLLARVQHPNVVTIFDADRLDGRAGLWMEFIHGRTLEQMLRAGHAFDEAEVIRIGADLCRALAAVHEAGLLHRDVKAQNVMFADSGRLVLMDFGTGLTLDDDSSAARGAAGTPLYIAPEIFAGKEATAQSDIYSVGVLLYHLLTNSYPIQGATADELRQAHARADGTELRIAGPGISDKLAQVIKRALQAEPERRFDNAESMAAALEALRPGNEHLQSWKTARPYWLGIAAIALATVCMLLFRGGWPGRISNDGARKGQDPGITSPLAVPGSHRLQLPNAPFWGKPSPDGGYFSFAKGDLGVLELRSGATRFLTHRKPGESQDYAGESVFSPDSRQVAYCWWSEEYQCFQLRTVGIDGGQPRVLMRSRGLESFNPVQWSQDSAQILGCMKMEEPGEMGCTLSLVSVSDGSLRRLKALPQRPFAGLSPDGRHIVYDRPKENSAGESEIRILATDGNTDSQLVSGPWNDSYPIWAPWRNSVVFASTRTGTLGLWEVPVSEGRAVGEPQNIARNIGRFAPVGLNTQGDFFYRLQTGLTDVCSVTIDPAKGKVQGPPANLARSFLGSNASPDWSPDGKSLAYVSNRREYGPNASVLVVQSLETGSQREFALPLSAMPAPRWSADGRFIAFRSAAALGKGEIRIVDIGTGEIVSTYGRAADVAWTRDMSQIYFLRIQNGLFRRDMRLQREELLYGIPKGHIGDLEGFRLSPDGQWIALTVNSNDECILCLVPTGGGPQRVLYQAKQSPHVAGWTHDGNTVLFTMRISWDAARLVETRGLWGISVTGGAPRSFDFPIESLHEARVSPDGRRIAFTRGFPVVEPWVMPALLSGSRE